MATTAMEQIERLAELSILRALGFVGLGIATVMLGLSFDAALSFETGALLAMITAVVLAFRAWDAPFRSVKETEVYLMMDGNFGLSPDRVQAQVGALLRRLYIRYARVAAGFAVGCWLFSLVARFT